MAVSWAELMVFLEMRTKKWQKKIFFNGMRHLRGMDSDF